MRLIVDGNSLLNAALLRGVDHDQGKVVTGENGKPVQVNSAQYGVDGFFEKVLDAVVETGLVPRNIICVWDGKNAKNRRRAYLPQYKEGRDKHPAVSEQLNIARETCTRLLKDMGATVMWQDGMEADDVIGYLCKTMLDERNIVRTEDGDMSVLVDDNTDVMRLGKLNENPFGRFPHKYITLYKALVGDSSDKIPGAKGFGDAAFVDMVRIFGLDALPEFERMIVFGALDELRENVPDLKSLQKVLDDKVGVNNSWNCARLHLEDVNTCSRPLQIQAGMIRQWSEVMEEAPHGFKEFYGTKTLVTAKNYDKALAQFKYAVESSPFVPLDIETSSGEASDDWMAQVNQVLERKGGIDVLGHELTGMSITFGANTQHTVYMSVDHAATSNITVDQCREFCEAIPKDLQIVVQNRSFEFSVLYRTWGDRWVNNGWHGFLPNTVDTKIGASYVNENLPKGLKERSKVHLGYEQVTYEATTTVSGPLKGIWYPGGEITKRWEVELVPAVYEQVRNTVAALDPETQEPTGEMIESWTVGKLLTPAVTETWVSKQYKMRELPAYHVFDYGCDDTICTGALHTYYQVVMQMERTWGTYLKVETDPEYLTSLAFVQGIPTNLSKLLEMERRDEGAYEDAWTVLRRYLMTKGWAGTECPEFEGDIEPSDVKLAAEILLDGEFTTRKRKLNAIASDIREQFPDSDVGELLAMAVERNDVNAFNKLVAQNFTGEPKINFGSPKQMQNLFYKVIGMTPRIFNSLTAKQKEDPTLVKAFKKQRDKKAGKPVEFSEEEFEALISKASTDDTAVDTALAMDDLSDAAKTVLKAFKAIKTIQTRRGLFYRTYKVMPHWRDGRIHPSLNQCEAATRRYSSSGPNIQQLPKRGEGVEFRQIILAHHKDAVVVSMDFSGQELRLGAELSGDEAMTSCFVGENLRDMHSLTAVSAAPLIWGTAVAYDVFLIMLESGDKEEKAKAKALRGDAKTVNFASQYGAMAAKIAETLMTDEATAQAFLDARNAAFPKIGEWSDRVQAEAKELGYALTMLGARRHLAEALNSDNKWDAMKAERQAGNFWIQGSGAEMTKLAMARMWRSGVFADGRFDAVFYAPIHDEVVFSVHRDQALELIKLVHPMMIAKYANMQIPIVSSISLGRNFGQQIEVGDYVDDDRINAALEEAFSA